MKNVSNTDINKLNWRFNHIYIFSDHKPGFLLYAMAALSPLSGNFLQYDALKPMFDYAEKIPVLNELHTKENLTARDLEAESRIFPRVLKEKKWPKDENGKIDLIQVAGIITKDQYTSAPILVLLYKLAITAGFTSTRVGCVFFL